MKRKYTLSQNFTWMLRYIREFDPPLLVWIAINAVATAAGNIVPIVFPKLIIDELTGGVGGTERVIWLAVIFGAAMFVTTGVTAISYGTAPPVPSGSMSIRFIALRLKFHVMQNLKNMTMDFEHLENPEVLDMASRATRAMDGNYVGVEGMSRQVLTMLRSLLTLIGTVAVVAVMGRWVLLVTLALLVVNYLLSDKARKREKEIRDSLAPTDRKVRYLEDMSGDFAYGKDIRLFSLKDLILGRLTKEQATAFAGNDKILKLWLNVGHGQSLTALAQEALMYAWLCRRVIVGTVGIGSFLMYITSIRTFSSALNDILDGFSSLQQQSAVITDYRAYIDIPDAPSGTGTPDADENGAEIEFAGVSFKYPGGDKYALQNVSFKIRAKEKLAVVGLNGAGKSTFIKLLMRLYSPESGRILLNGVDIQTYDREEYFKLFAAVFQDINMFAFTVAENISMRAREKTDAPRVRRALELAGLSAKIDSLPKGAATSMLKNLDLDGAELSGGETQKLALARALYKNAPFIVLDEPTAALDALAEERLYLEFDKLTQGKTAVYISHRLASTRFCDRIALFEDGMIAECGTHDELLLRGGKYAGLFNIQAQYYRDGAGQREEDAAI